MLNNQYDNHLGTNGFAFVEFSSQNKSVFHQHFTNLGFTLCAHANNQQDVELWQQGQIIFIVNNQADSKTKEFASLHGDSACSMGFYVKDPKTAYSEALKRGAKPYLNCSTSIFNDLYAIEGVGGSAIYLVSQHDEFLDKFNFINLAKNTMGLELIDHLTHNVYRGHMEAWADFYTKIFGFKQIRYFDIDGKKTGLFSKAMTSPCGKIKIPLNESKDDKSQIEEFLHKFNGEGIQHIALTTKDIYKTISSMRNSGVDFMDTPNTYYELINKRLPQHGENISLLQQDKILIDGVTTPNRKLLLQIFTNNLFGPVFFEIIQRKGDEGFGEGNFQALFDSIELDQERRGVLV